MFRSSSPDTRTRWLAAAAAAAATAVLATSMAVVPAAAAAARPTAGTARAAAASAGTAAPAGTAAGSQAASLPGGKGPVGWDTYRHLDQLPDLSSGVQTKQFSSFDRTGGNADSGRCLRQTSSGGCVLAERTGPGEIDSIWTTSNGGDVTQSGNIHVVLDGTTVLDAPEQDVVNGTLGAPFTYPLVANASQSSGGAVIMVPMPYRSSMLVYTDHNPSYYHVTYRDFPDANGVSTFDPSDKALDVLAKLNAAGTADPKPAAPGASSTNQSFTLQPGQSVPLADLRGPGAISQLQLHIPQLAASASSADPNDPAVLASNDVLQNARLRISFDGEQTVDAPLGQFFGSGLGLTQVKALMYAMDPSAKTMTSWWPMPFRDRATVELYNGSSHAITAADSSVTSAPDPSVAQQLTPSGDSAYFRATANGGPTTPGQDYQFLHTSGQGKFVGVTESMTGPASRAYLEGDERVYADGSHTPQIHGTGTEDFYEGGWYFNHGTFTDPVNGEPLHEGSGTAGCPAGGDCTGTYRSMIEDAVPFGSSLTFGIEHGGRDDVQANYSSTAYWYGRDAGTQQLTDTLDIGNPASEQAHGYKSADSGATSLTSDYEGFDLIPPPATYQVRSATAPVSFQLHLGKQNSGVLLRRMSDQANAYQRADVAVDGQPAGTWLEPLGNPDHRWLDDTFWLPSALTAGKSVITVTLTPAAGSPAWTAARYTAQSVVAPFTDRTAPGQVSGLTATGDQTDTIQLSWQPATDNVGVDHYNVYASTSPDAAAGPATLIGQTTTTTFDHPVGLKERWYYRVSAVDPAGNQGSPSAQATATSGDEIGFDTGTAGEQPWLWDADGSAIDGANRRFADGTHYFVYRFTLPAGTTSGTATLSIDNEYLVQASSDGQNWTTVMTETNQIRDGSNKADRSIDITPYLGAGKTVYIRVADSFPQDGWGGRVSHVTVTFN